MGTDNFNVKVNLIGKRFGRLTVLKITTKHKKQIRWRCVCSCGRELLVYGGHLKNGNTKSCGCLQREKTSIARKIHGHSRIKSRTYHSWCAMKQRVLNSNAENYERYGGRGIKICRRWINSFSNFLSDMGESPSSGYSIDRIRNMGNYTPRNCKWSTVKEQNNNRRDNKRGNMKEKWEPAILT